jgi:dissimilatory sulfite reductase (desulfoviridin) alpha/beta subunit
MQRMVILVKKKQIEDAKKQLAEVDLNVGVIEPEVWNPMGCPGKLCKYTRQDALVDVVWLALKLIDK